MYQKEVKADLISKEEKRLKRIYSKLAEESKNVIEGLVRRAAYMRVTLEEYEDDLDTGGYVELFTQSDKTEPYERERPVARLYNTMNKNYQSIIKQLGDLLPKGEAITDDGFDDFVNDRED